MKLTAGQASKETGVSIPTITRAIKSGKMSADRLEGGGYQIDPAELFRVFPAVSRNTNATLPMLGHETPSNANVLEAELKAEREKVALLMSERDDLRRRLDNADDERAKLLGLLDYKGPLSGTQEAAQPSKPKKRWWQ